MYFLIDEDVCWNVRNAYGSIIKREHHIEVHCVQICLYFLVLLTFNFKTALDLSLWHMVYDEYAGKINIHCQFHTLITSSFQKKSWKFQKNDCQCLVDTYYKLNIVRSYVDCECLDSVLQELDQQP